MNTKNILYVALLFLGSCGQNTQNNTQKNQTIEERIFPENIKTVGSMNGNRSFEYQGKKMFNGATFYNAQTFSSKGYCIVSKKVEGKELFGVINAKGKTVIEFKYEHLDGLSYVHYGYFKFMDKKNYTNGFIDTTGKVVVPAKYKEFGTIITEGTIKVGASYNRWGLISMKDEPIIPMEYDFVSAWSDGLIRVRRGNVHGFFDRSGKVAIPIQFTKATDFESGIAIVQKGGKFGAIDIKGEKAIDFLYDDYLEMVAVSKDDYSSSGFKESLMGFILKGGYIGVKKNGKWGYIDTKGNEVIPFEYDQVWLPEKSDPNKAMIRKGEKRGYFDLTNKQVSFFEK
jgi:WG containing repeat